MGPSGPAAKQDTGRCQSSAAAFCRIWRLAHIWHIGYLRTSSAANVGEGKDSEARQRTMFALPRPPGNAITRSGLPSSSTSPAAAPSFAP
jgi:hypothetical protein